MSHLFVWNFIGGVTTSTSVQHLNFVTKIHKNDIINSSSTDLMIGHTEPSIRDRSGESAVWEISVSFLMRFFPNIDPRMSNAALQPWIGALSKN